jgi:predicted Zn finger-like uncharacterized protein
MILTCPSCATRFRVADEALRRPGGRLVRCANCRHSWRYGLEEPAPLRAEPEPPAPMPTTPATPVLAPIRPEAVLPPVPERSHWMGVVAVLAILVLGTAALIGVVERREIAALYPAASGLYARIGLSAQPPAGDAPKPALKIEHIAASRTQHGLIIEGDIQNTGSATSDVPRLRISLQDRNSHELQSEIIDAPEAQVSAGAHIHFSAPFANPDRSATDVEVTFAAGAAEPGGPGAEPSPSPSTAPFPRDTKS